MLENGKWRNSGQQEARSERNNEETMNIVHGIITHGQANFNKASDQRKGYKEHDRVYSDHYYANIILMHALTHLTKLEERKLLTVIQ